MIFFPTTDEDFQHFRGKGYTGSINDMHYKALGDLNHTGALSDRIHSFLVSEYGSFYEPMRDLRNTTASFVALRYGVGAIQPEFVLDFGEEYYRVDGLKTALSDTVTHSRASNATMVDSTGTLVTVGNDVPRVGHHVWSGSAWVNEGILHESEARTNSLLYSTLGGAAVGVVGSGGSLPTGWFTTSMPSGSVEVVSLTDKDGKPNIRLRLNGTPTGATVGIFFIGSTSLVAATGQSWTSSAFVQKVAGSLTNFTDIRIQVDERTAAGGFLGTTSPVFTGDVDYDVQRVATRTLTDATAERVNTSVQLTSVVGPIDITLDISATQLEQGATPSSYIPTTTATATRAAETLTVPAANMPDYQTPTVIGGERVTNGTFDTDLTGWSSHNSAVLSWNAASAINVDSNGTLTGNAYQSFATVIGGVYRVSADVTPTATEDAILAAGTTQGSGGDLATDVVSAGAGLSPTSLVFTATASTSFVRLGRTTNTTGQPVTADNISVKEINPLAVSIQMQGRMTYADGGSFTDGVFFGWYDGYDDFITYRASGYTTSSGEVTFVQTDASVQDTVSSSNGVITEGVFSPFNLSSRHGSSFINGAVDGTALTADLTPTAIPDLSAADFEIGTTFNGTISKLRVWGEDIGDTGIAEAST